MDKILRWAGTVSYFIGIALTSTNNYPYNLFFQTVGAAMWVWAGARVKDYPLTINEGAALVMYGSGLLYVIWKLINGN